MPAPRTFRPALTVLLAGAALAFPISAQAQTEVIRGSGVVPAIPPGSAVRPLQFGVGGTDGSTLVVLTTDGTVASNVPLSGDARATVSTAVAAAKFTGKANKTLSLYGVGPYARVLLVGTGKDVTPLSIAEAAGEAAQALMSVNTPVTVSGVADAALADAAYGYALGQYRFDRYKSEARKEPPATQAVTFAASSADAARTAEAAFRGRQQWLVRGVTMTRDLITEPASVIYPESFVARVREQLAGLPNVTVEVLDEAAMRRLNMGALVGVGQGSPRGSRLMVVTYRGATGAPIALVGKGITFDSGGISLKPGAGMWAMKGDMAGAAAVMGTLVSLAGSRAPVHVVAVAALAENMPDGNAQRPGDVVRTMSGKTVEVVNTDAEGRLVLADAVEYVQARIKPSMIVDVATLTGAVSGALGDEYAGLFTRDNALADTLTQAGKASGEFVWRLPLHPNHAKDIESEIADVRNSTEGGAPGASHGAAFIAHFVDEAMPWVHLDIAGVDWNSKSAPLNPKGSPGYGVRLLDRFVRDQAK